MLTVPPNRKTIGKKLVKNRLNLIKSYTNHKTVQLHLRQTEKTF